MSWAREHLIEIILGVIVLALIVIGGFAVKAWGEQHTAWVEDCTAKGGKVTKDTKSSTGTGIDPSTGKPVVVTSSSTTYYCLSDDGRILGIEGSS